MARIDDYYRGQDRPQTLGQLIGLFKDAARRHIHANKDNDLWDHGERIVDQGHERLINLQRGELECTCRYISRTMVDVLHTIGIGAREVGWVASEYRPRDIRHTTFEAYFDGEPFHVDIDMNVLFGCVDDGTRWGALELRDRLAAGVVGERNLERLTSHKRVSTDRDLLVPLLRDDRKLIDWYAHKSDALIIGDDVYTELPPERIQPHLVDSLRAYARFRTRNEFIEAHYTTPSQEGGWILPE